MPCYSCVCVCCVAGACACVAAGGGGGLQMLGPTIVIPNWGTATDNGQVCVRTRGGGIGAASAFGRGD